MALAVALLPPACYLFFQPHFFFRFRLPTVLPVFTQRFETTERLFYRRYDSERRLSQNQPLSTVIPGMSSDDDDSRMSTWHLRESRLRAHQFSTPCLPCPPRRVRSCHASAPPIHIAPEGR